MTIKLEDFKKECEMPRKSDIYEYGYRLGWAVARNCRKEMSQIHKLEMPSVIGGKMDAAIKSVDAYSASVPDWKVGFFDGFYNFLDQIMMD